jgi:hypothetical protein
MGLAPRSTALTTLRRGIDAGRLRADIDPDLILDPMLGAPTHWWLTTVRPSQNDNRRVLAAIKYLES